MSSSLPSLLTVVEVAEVDVEAVAMKSGDNVKVLPTLSSRNTLGDGNRGSKSQNQMRRQMAEGDMWW